MTAGIGFGGVRPSPGAATTEQAGALDSLTSSLLSNIAAPGVGRTPKTQPPSSLTHRRLGPFHLAGGHLVRHTIRMAVALPIRRISRTDKLRAMEALWADLSRDEAEIDSPGWHGVILRGTDQLVREGNAKFSDW